MEDVHKNTSVLPNVFNTEELHKIKNLLLKLKKTDGYPADRPKADHIQAGTEPIQEHYGTDQKGIIYPLLLKMFRKKLEHVFGKFEIVFVSYANSRKPVGLHTDHHYHIEKGLPGKNYFSFIVPYSVDDNLEKCDMASTVIFDDYAKYERQDNAVAHHQTYLKHISESELGTVRVKQKHKWQHGSLIWWDSELFHASGCYDEFETKQCLVGHTYIL